jgi:hypothetical protein
MFAAETYKAIGRSKGMGDFSTLDEPRSTPRSTRADRTNAGYRLNGTNNYPARQLSDVRPAVPVLVRGISCRAGRGNGFQLWGV